MKLIHKIKHSNITRITQNKYFGNFMNFFFLILRLIVLLTVLISINTRCKTYFKHKFAKNCNEEKIDKFIGQNKFKFLLFLMQKNIQIFKKINVFEIVYRQ